MVAPIELCEPYACPIILNITLGTHKLPGIPKSAVVQRDGQAHAFIVIDDQLEERVIALGPSSNGPLGVLEGVKAGERIVVSDVAKLSNGQRVR